MNAKSEAHTMPRASTKAPFFHVDHLTRRFGGVTAVDALSFTLERGQLFSIIGPNGAGKTTVFNCISGLYAPTSGQITFEGTPLVGLKPHQIAAAGLARTFQNLELFAHSTTMENLMLGRHLHIRGGLWRGLMMFHRKTRAAQEEIAHRAHVERIIDLLDLHAVRDKPVGGLPYGTQKLIELGRALAVEPKLLLLDEPSAGMNAEERQDLIFWIQDIRAELGLTILMIEHHMDMVTQVSDRMLAINFGRPIVEGTPEDVIHHPEVIEAYLGRE